MEAASKALAFYNLSFYNLPPLPLAAGRILNRTPESEIEIRKDSVLPWNPRLTLRRKGGRGISRPMKSSLAEALPEELQLSRVPGKMMRPLHANLHRAAA